MGTVSCIKVGGCFMKSVYIHIPFCKEICSYCDFCKMLYHSSFVDCYLNALEKEVKDNYLGEILDTIYIGGGSPSCLSIKQLKKLFEITSLFKTSPHLEFTMEANFDSCDEEKLLLFKKNKVNRLSFGIESFEPKFLKVMKRNLSYEEVLEKIKICRKLGFDHINVDLMYGFKDQTLEDLKEDLNKVLSLSVDHISTYSLILEEHTELYIHHYKRANDDLDSKMYSLIMKDLEDNGFYHYEISNFCKEGHESKHNLTYWNNEEYYGFGLGASGYIKNRRYTNTRSLTNYLTGKRVLEIESLTLEEQMSYEMILGLRKTRGVSKKEFQRKYHLTIEEKFAIMELIKNQLLIDDGEYIFIPKEKLYVSNAILIAFVGGNVCG